MLNEIVASFEVPDRRLFRSDVEKIIFSQDNRCIAPYSNWAPNEEQSQASPLKLNSSVFRTFLYGCSKFLLPKTTTLYHNVKCIGSTSL